MAKQREKHTNGFSMRRLVLWAYDWVGTAVLALSILCFLIAYVFRIVGVEGASMQPTLQDGDRLLLSAFDTQYECGDIIVVDRYTKEPLVKRVIAVGGQTLRIDQDGNVFVNDKLIQEPYIQGKTELKEFAGVVKVPRGYLFVMGDNRTVSKDSRMNEVGLVSVKDVVGKTVSCVWPISSFQIF